MAIDGAPDLASVKEWLGIDPADTQDDNLLQTSLDAALAAQAAVVTYPVDDTDAPVFVDDLYEAALLRTQRLAARRNSPEAIVGITGTAGDFVSARLTSTDPDIVRLEGPWFTMVVA
jgi:hypothetical protein